MLQKAPIEIDPKTNRDQVKGIAFPEELRKQFTGSPETFQVRAERPNTPLSQWEKTGKDLDAASKSGDLQKTQQALLTLAKLAAHADGPTKKAIDDYINRFLSSARNSEETKLREAQINVSREVARGGESAMSQLAEKSVKTLLNPKYDDKSSAEALLNILLIQHSRSGNEFPQIETIFQKAQAIDLTRKLQASMGSKEDFTENLDMLFILRKSNPFANSVVHSLAKLAGIAEASLDKNGAKDLKANLLFHQEPGKLIAKLSEILENQSRTMASDFPSDQRRQSAQNLILADIQRFMQPNKDEKPEAFEARVKTTRSNIEAEQKLGQFGPASKAAWTQYTKWMEETVPAELRALVKFKIPIPPGCIALLPKDPYQRAISPELFLSQAPGLKLDLKASGGIPSQQEVDLLRTGSKFIEDCLTRHADFLNKVSINEIKIFFKQHGWPTTQLDNPKIDPQVVLANAAHLVDQYKTCQAYLAAMKDMHKKSDDKYPIEIPPGATAKWDEKTGRLTLNLNLPIEQQLSTPEILPSVQRIDQWTDRITPHIQQLLTEWTQAEGNIDKVCRWEDIEVKPDLMGRFVKGRFVDLVSKDYQCQDGETKKEVNLVEYRPEIKTVVRKNEKNEDVQEVVVTQKVRACTVNKYVGYQNLLRTQVGEPMETTAHTYKPGNFVPYFDDGKLVLKQAKDLAGAVRIKRLLDTGAIILSASLDASMLVSGGLGVIAAKGLLKAAIKNQMVKGIEKLSVREAAYQLGDATLRLTAGAAGFADNAGMRYTEFGSLVNQARRYYFLADAGRAASNLALRRAGFAGGGSAEKLEAYVKEEMSSTFRRAYNGSNRAFKTLEPFIAMQIGAGLFRTIEKIATPKDKHKVEEFIDKQRGKEPKDFLTAKNPQSVETALTQIDKYGARLIDGKTGQAREDIIKILNDTKRLLSGNAPPELREAYRNEIFGAMCFNESEMRRLHREGRDGYFTAEDLRILMDPDRSKETDHDKGKPRFREFQAAVGKEKVESTDKDVQAARAMALLYLGCQPDGKLPEVLATNSFKAKAFSNGETVIPAREIKQIIKTEDVMRMLRQDLEKTNLERRGSVTSDLLLNFQGLSVKEYAYPYLNDSLLDPKLSKKERMELLAGNGAAVLDFMYGADRLINSKGAGASEALVKTYERIARSDADPDLQLMAAMVLFNTRDRRTLEHDAMAKTIQDNAAKLSGKPGAFAQWAKAYLSEEMTAMLPPQELGEQLLLPAKRAKLNAAVSMSLLSDQQQEKEQKEIAKAIVQSISAQDRDLSQEAIKALLPTRFKVLDAADAARVVDAAVALCQCPAKGQPALQPHEVDQVNRMIELTKTLLDSTKDSTDKRVQAQRDAQFAKALQAMIDPNNDRFAQLYPTIRVAAINALATFGADEESKRLIRGRLSPVFEGRPAGVQEDPRVREAAARVLLQLGDPKLSGDDLWKVIDSTQDIAVASALRDAMSTRLSQASLPRDSRQWKKMSEKTEAILNREGIIPTLTDAALIKRIKEFRGNSDKPTLLDVDIFKIELKDKVWHAACWYNRHVYAVFGGNTTGELNKKGAEAAQELEKTRVESWNKLAEEARKEGGADSLAMVNHILLHSGRPIASDGNITVFRDQDDADKAMRKAKEKGEEPKYDPDNAILSIANTPGIWQVRAAGALVAACKGPNKELALLYLEKTLTATHTLPEEARLVLINGWKDYVNEHPEKDREFKLDITARALELQLIAEPKSAKAMIELMNILYGFRDRNVLPVLEGISKSNLPGIEEAKNHARMIFGNLADSIIVMWGDARENRISTGAQRAEALRELLARKAMLDSEPQKRMTAESLTMELFNIYKGHTFQDDRDPGLAPLMALMTNADPLIRNAACRVLHECNLDSPSLKPNIAKAMVTLANTVAASVPGSVTPQRLDAYVSPISLKRYQDEAKAMMKHFMGAKDRVEIQPDGVRKQYIITKKPDGDISVEIKIPDTVRRTELTGGNFIELRTDDSNTVVGITTPDLGAWRSTDGLNFVNDKGERRLFSRCQMNADGGISFDAHNARYTYKQDGTVEKAALQADLPGGRIIMAGGHPESIYYSTHAARFMQWSGAEITRMDFRSSDGASRVVFGRFISGGKWTDRYVIYNFDRNEKGEMIEGKPVIAHGKLDVSNDGTFSWIGQDGKWQRQTLGGVLESGETKSK